MKISFPGLTFHSHWKNQLHQNYWNRTDYLVQCGALRLSFTCHANYVLCVIQFSNRYRITYWKHDLLYLRICVENFISQSTKYVQITANIDVKMNRVCRDWCVIVHGRSLVCVCQLASMLFANRRLQSDLYFWCK